MSRLCDITWSLRSSPHADHPHVPCLSRQAQPQGKPSCSQSIPTHPEPVQDSALALDRWSIQDHQSQHAGVLWHILRCCHSEKVRLGRWSWANPTGWPPILWQSFPSEVRLWGLPCWLWRSSAPHAVVQSRRVVDWYRRRAVTGCISCHHAGNYTTSVHASSSVAVSACVGLFRVYCLQIGSREAVKVKAFWVSLVIQASWHLVCNAYSQKPWYAHASCISCCSVVLCLLVRIISGKKWEVN